MPVSIALDPTKSDAPSGRRGQYTADGSGTGYEDVWRRCVPPASGTPQGSEPGGIDVICVHLTDRISDGPELLVGHNSANDLLALPAREDLAGLGDRVPAVKRARGQRHRLHGEPRRRRHCASRHHFPADGCQLAPGRPLPAGADDPAGPAYGASRDRRKAR